MKINLGQNYVGLHFLVLLGLALMLMLTLGAASRALVYLNMIFVVAYAMSFVRQKTKSDLEKSFTILVLPLGFSLLHVIAVGQVELIKDIRHIWLAAFIALGVWMLAKRDMRYVQQHAAPLVVLLLFAYVLMGIIGLVFSLDVYGTTKNPHYLALYSALGIPIALYFMRGTTGKLRLLLILMTLSMGYFVLYTSSRPAWLVLIIGALMLLLFLKGHVRIMSAIVFSLFLAVLFFTNVANFGDRFVELASNINHEERVTIWRDAWEMQKTSNPMQWLYGHGLDSYEEDFKQYSSYSGVINFVSPHNSILELLYISGIIGVGLYVSLYIFLYIGLFRILKKADKYQHLAQLLIILMTMHLLFIFITMPAFSRYSIYILAFIAGAFLFIKEAQATSNHD